MSIPDPSSRSTYEDWLQLEGNWELIEGKLYNMTPAPSSNHQFAVGELYFALRSFFQNRDCYVFTSPFDVYLSENEDYDRPNQIIQPDLAVVCNKNKIVSKGCQGAPTLIVEVLSPSTALKDYNEKFDLYQRFGIDEYWIVDTANKMVHIYNHLKDGIYTARTTYGEHDILKSIIFAELSISLQSVFAL